MSKSGNFDQNQTKNQTFLKEKSDIRPWSAKADHSGHTAKAHNRGGGGIDNLRAQHEIWENWWSGRHKQHDQDDTPTTLAEC